MNSEAAPATKPAPSRAWLIAAIVFVLGFDVAFAWQRRASATTSEFGAHPAEGAHFTTALAVRQWMLNLSGLDHQRTLQQVGAHYPIVSPRLWPPVFPTAQAAWISAFGKSRTSMLMLMCLVAATLALLLHLALREEAGPWVGAIAAALLLSLPIVREHSAVLLPALLCATFMFGAAMAFGRVLDRAQLNDAVAFGILSGLAMLTDHAGFALLGFVPLALLFSGNWRRLASAPLWIGLAIAAGIVLPAAWPISSANWPRPALDFTRAALPFYGVGLLAAVGAVLVALMVPGLVVKLSRTSERTGKWAASGALLVSALFFAIVFPVDLDHSQLIAAVPAALMFAAAGAAAIGARFSRSPALILLVAAVLSVVLFETVTKTWRVKRWSGFRPLVEIVMNDDEHPNARILICSDRAGEGMFISEIAMAEERPTRLIERADALIAKSRFSEDESLADMLSSLQLDYIVFDESNPDLDNQPRYDMLRRVLREHSDRFWEMSSVPVMRDGIQLEASARLYRVMRTNLN